MAFSSPATGLPAEAPAANPAAGALPELIRQEILAAGAISFARFMELALYHPAYGYYEQAPRKIGRQGDYYTSVSVGSVFGELLGFQFAQWIERWPAVPWQLVEAGAHDGGLAADILGWLRQSRPDLYTAMEYWIVEPSARRRRWQSETLATHAGKVRWLEAIPQPAVSWPPIAPADAGRLCPPKNLPAADASATLPASAGVNGIIFANELLDAMPVHIMVWDAKAGQWFERGVRLENGQFVWVRLPFDAGGRRSRPEASVVACPSSVASQAEPRGGGTNHRAARLAPQLNLPSALRSALPDGYTTEVCPAATTWWAAAARSLRRGKLLTFDYGALPTLGLTPHRPQGSLRAYYRHRLSADLLARAGEQDLTANVNFAALQALGEAAGLQTEGLFSQATFLTGMLQAAHQAPGRFPAWTPLRLRQFHTLTHPDHLGQTFKVLLQSRTHDPGSDTLQLDHQ